MGHRGKQIIKLLIRAVITIALLIVVFYQIDFKQFKGAVKTWRWDYIILVEILTVVFFWFRCLTLKLIMDKQNCRVTVHTLFRASTITSLYGMILPGLLSTGAKWYILKKDTGKGTNVFSSMMYNQFSIVMTAIMCSLGALIVTNPTSVLMNKATNPMLLPVVCGVLLFLVTLFYILIINHRTGSILIKTFHFILKRFPARLNEKGTEIIDQMAAFQAAGWWFHFLIGFINIIGTLAGGMVIYMLAARGANIEIPLGIFVWLWGFVFILGRLPISIGNLGVREFTLMGILAKYGVEKSDALLMSMILFSTILLISAIGAFYLIYGLFETKRKSNSGTDKK
jgi:uncharacterized membrane protein YbhN (UPF0104 family)